MSNINRLVASIIHFLGDQLRNESLKDDGRESLEGKQKSIKWRCQCWLNHSFFVKWHLICIKAWSTICFRWFYFYITIILNFLIYLSLVAIQCLETAYGISASDAHLLPSRGLKEIFDEAVESEPIKDVSDVLNWSDWLELLPDSNINFKIEFKIIFTFPYRLKRKHLRKTRKKLNAWRTREISWWNVKISKKLWNVTPRPFSWTNTMLFSTATGMIFSLFVMILSHFLFLHLIATFNWRILSHYLFFSSYTVPLRLAS